MRCCEQRFDQVAHVPVVFTAGGKSYPIKATTLGVEADWASALESAAREGEGFGPVRGFRRLQARFFGAEVMPPVQAYAAALDYKLAGLAREIDQSHVEAKLVRRGLSIELVPGQAGLQLDRKAAESRIVRALARLERGGTVALPVRIEPVEVDAADLAPAARQARLALSAPVRLEYSGVRWKLPRWRIAELLSLPVDGKTELAIAGAGSRGVVHEAAQDRRARAGRRALRGHRRRRDPDPPGQARPRHRRARDREGAPRGRDLAHRLAPPQLAARTTVADRTAAEAQAMGITGVVGSYYTTYGGIASRLHNVALVAELIDGTLVAPGKTFSFNGTTGERTAEKGFQEAPVIINGELQTGLGGGICQVSTTVFNAAYEAGLQIDERTNHALYISHYPLGRDATVNYPDLDLKFTNDTDNWLLVRTFVGSGSLTVNIYGTPQNRRVESTGAAAPRRRRTEGEARSRPDAAEGRERGGRIRRAGARDERQPEGLRRERQAAARGHLVLAVPVRAEGRPRRDEAKAEAEEAEAAEGRPARPRRSGRRPERSAGFYASALAISSTNQAGTRVGRRVAASTIACEVWPSATSVPSRSIAYS